MNTLRSDLQEARERYQAAKEAGDALAEAKADAEWNAAYEMRSSVAVRDYDETAQFLADHIVAWTWTGKTGKPLPQPDGTIGPIQRLLPDEVWYLQGVISDETPLEESSASSV